MNYTEFNEAIFRYLKIIENNIIMKNGQYAPSEDKLHAFNRAAEINHECREKALWGMATKHLVSVLDLIDQMDAGETPTQEVIDEKLGDLGSYMALLYACFNKSINTVTK